MSRRVPVPTVRGGRLAAANRLDELRTVSHELTQVETRATVLRNRQHQLIYDAYTLDRTYPSQIANVIGVSRQRVNQIITKIREKGAPA